MRKRGPDDKKLSVGAAREARAAGIEDRPPPYLAWSVWGLGAVLYFSGFFHRVAPAVMADPLMADFRIGAAALGNFSAFYFYSYVAMQIPTGILADLWGPRKLLSAGALASSVGAVMFALAPTMVLADLGRLIIGGSVAVAYVSLLKLATHWFPPHRFAVMGGLALLCGVVGAVFAGAPLRFLVDRFTWRPVMLAAGVLSLAIAAGIWRVVRDTPEEKGYTGYAPPTGHPKAPGGMAALAWGLKTVLSYKNAWLVPLATAGMVGPVLAFAGLWGVPFLTTHYGMSAAGAATLTSAMMVAWAISGPMMGGLSDRIGRRKPLFLGGALAAAAGWFTLVYVPGLPLGLLTGLLLAVGIASGAMIIGFAFAKESVPRALAGTVTGVCNMGAMSGPMILQPAIGLVLEKNWAGTVENGVRIYGLGAYRTGFTLIVGFAALTALLVALSTETRCRQMARS